MATDTEIKSALDNGWSTRKITSTLHCGPSRVQRVRHSGVSARKETKDEPKGLQGFKQMFDVTSRAITKIEGIIDGELKARGWMYDSEMKQLAACDGSRWVNIRRDYEHLLVTVKDPDSRANKTVWCHPDIVAEAREIAR